MDSYTLSIRKVVFIITILGAFIAPFMGSSLNVALPQIGHEFNMSATLLSWANASYLISTAFLLLPIGLIADVKGRKKIYFRGSIIYIIASILSALSPNAEIFIFSRILSGIAAAMVFSTGMAILTSVFHSQERGRVLGINASAVYIGLCIGPWIGSILTYYFSWRSLFWFNLLLIVPIPFLLEIYLKDHEWVNQSDMPFRKLFSNTIRNKTFIYANISALMHYASTFGVGFILSLYLQYVKKYTILQTGHLLLIQPLIMTFMSPLCGYISDKRSSRQLTSIGLSINLIGLILLIPISFQTNLTTIIMSQIIMGVGLSLFATPNVHSALNAIPKEHHGFASSLLGTARLSGQMISNTIISLIFGFYMGTQTVNEQTLDFFLKGSRLSFAIFGLCCILALISSIKKDKYYA